jgi:hypothetical protein
MSRHFPSSFRRNPILALAALSLAACGNSNGAASSDGGSGPGDDGGGSGDGGTAGSGTDAGGGTSEAGATEEGGGTTDGGSLSDGEPGGGGLGVNLGSAGNFVILSKSGISTVPTSAITGDIGVSPAAATYITGFALTSAATNVFATSPQVTGKVYASTYAPPTPSNLTTAVGDMQTAYTDAAGRAPKVTELGAGNIGGMTLSAGVYKWSSGLQIPTSVTLTGSGTDVWIFQIAKNLTMSSAVSVLLAGGATPKNIYWQVAGSVNLGTTSHFEGTILTQTSIAMGTGASINGRLLAQTAVSIESSDVVAP